MPRGEIAIIEQSCKGCQLCTKFCSRGCITTSDRLSARGYRLPAFTQPEKCNACGVCGWMCPDYAIAVYRYVEA